MGNHDPFAQQAGLFGGLGSLGQGLIGQRDARAQQLSAWTDITAILADTSAISLPDVLSGHPVEPKKPTFIESLRKETDEWLKGVLD